MATGLACFDMDRVLVDHLSTWQYVYDRLEISNEEAFNLYNQGKLDEWDWIIEDIALIKRGCAERLGVPLTDGLLRGWLDGCPMMKGWKECLSTLLDAGWEVAIVSGGMQETARRIAAEFPSDQPWRRRLGGIDRQTSVERCDGKDTRLHIFTNGWVAGSDGSIPDTGRYQVAMGGKGVIVRMLQRRLGILKERTVGVGDSTGDIGMFEASGLSINFNPWDDRAKAHADLVIEDKDLTLVLQEIEKAFL